jgi:hypothetical protein
MAASALRPATPEESLVYWGIVGTWGLWLLGALYIAGPVIGWLLIGLMIARWVGLDPTTDRGLHTIPLGAWVWILGMAMMLVALVAGHLSFNLGLPQTIKSTIGWMKGWALMAIFLLAGACLRVRPALIYRAVCVLALQTLIITPLLVLAALAGLPESLYVSPLRLVGGPGPEFFEVQLYSFNAGSGTVRWRFFAPWAPGAAFIANVHLVLAARERDWRWKSVGVVAAILVCLMSQSRLGLIAMPVVALAVFGLSRLLKPWVMAVAAALSVALGMIADRLILLVQGAIDSFHAARADSSRVRKILGDIALHRWRAEAPIWGHGIVERGPHLVEYMPIGSHHSWYGLLFVKGIVGLAALALPMLWTFIEMLVKAQASRTARASLGVILVLFLYTFGENLEILVYLFWPGLVVVGIASRQRLANPLRSPLGR